MYDIKNIKIDGQNIEVLVFSNSIPTYYFYQTVESEGFDIDPFWVADHCGEVKLIELHFCRPEDRAIIEKLIDDEYYWRLLETQHA